MRLDCIVFFYTHFRNTSDFFERFSTFPQMMYVHSFSKLRDSFVFFVCCCLFRDVLQHAFAFTFTLICDAYQNDTKMFQRCISVFFRMFNMCLDSFSPHAWTEGSADSLCSMVHSFPPISIFLLFSPWHSQMFETTFP